MKALWTFVAARVMIMLRFDMAFGTKTDAVFFYVAAVWNFVSVSNMVSVKAPRILAHSTLVAVSLEDFRPEI